MAKKKYASLSSLQTFLDNLKITFASIAHTHTINDISDFSIDSALSSESTNPVQNKVVNAEFDAISKAMAALESSIDDKAEEKHIHSIEDVTNLQATIDAINDEVSNKSAIQIITWGADD